MRQQSLRNSINAMGGALAVSLCMLSSAAQAGPIVQATSVSTNMGSFSSSFPISNVISPNELSPTYTVGVTDFDTYVATASGTFGFGWQSTPGIASGFVTFNFGAATPLARLALWQSNWTTGGGAVDVKNFDIYSDTDANPFNGGMALLGSFTAIQANDPTKAQVFDFSDASTQFLHMNILTNHGGSGSGFEDIIFASGVPEPIPLALLGLGLLGLRFTRRRSG